MNKLVIKTVSRQPWESKAEALEMQGWFQAANPDRIRDLPDGTPVRIAIKVKKKKWKLVPGFVGTWTDDCTCGSCDWVRVKVLVPRQHWESHLKSEARALSWDQFWKIRNENREMREIL